MTRRHDWQKEEKRAVDDDDDASPPTGDELAEKLVRIDGDVNERWRWCRAGICHRRRACSAAGVPCWDPAVVREEDLHSDDRLVRGAARLMSSYRGTPRPLIPAKARTEARNEPRPAGPGARGPSL